MNDIVVNSRISLYNFKFNNSTQDFFFQTSDLISYHLVKMMQKYEIAEYFFFISCRQQ